MNIIENEALWLVSNWPSLLKPYLVRLNQLHRPFLVIDHKYINRFMFGVHFVEFTVSCTAIIGSVVLSKLKN